MTLINLQGRFSNFCLNISVAYISGLLIESPGNLTKDGITNDLP